MKAELTLENIGSHRGFRNYDINSGKITIFEGANSSGKSTIIKSIATILSSPIRSKNLRDEANMFGILPKDEKDSPIVNIFEDKAQISLNYNDFDLTAEIFKNGEIEINFPKNFQSNENFLYACMLVKNSKIQRYLASGDDNFQWIVSEMSFAGKYVELSETNNSYVRLINAAKNTMVDINNKIGKYIDENKKLKAKKQELEKEINKVNEEIKSLPKSDNPEFVKFENDQEKILNKINDLKIGLDGFKKQKDTKSKELKNISYDIDNLELEKNKLIEGIKKIEKEIEEIKKINPDEEYKKISKNQIIVESIIAEQSSLKTLRELYNTILNSRLESDTCPICESKISITKDNSSNKLKEFNKKLEQILIKKNQIGEEKKISENKIKLASSLKSKEDQRIKKNKAISSKATQISSKKNKPKTIESELRGINNNIERTEKLLLDNKKNLEEIEKKIEILVKEDEEHNELIQKKKKISENVKKIEINIGKNDELIKENSNIDLLGIKIPIEEVDNINDKLSKELEKIELYLNEKIDEQRIGAGKKFNETIRKVIEDLELEDFDDISLDLKNYHLNVVRKGGKTQPLGALGGAERGIIGGILQVSCKQTYLRDIPFFVGDDIILELDPVMSKKFTDYLRKLAVEDDLYIIITRITNNKQLNQVEI